MKQLLLASVLTLSTALGTAAETITVGSTAYEVTRNERQVAKGVKYTELLFPGRTYTGYTGGGRVHVVEVDLTEPTVKLEMVNNGTMSGTKTLANHAASVKKTGYVPVAGANANFWITSEQPWKSQIPGQPHGVAIRNGSMFTDPNVKTNAHCGGPAITGMVAVDENGKVYIDRVKPQLANYDDGSGFAFHVKHLGIGHVFDLDMCNRVVNGVTASIYNRNYGTAKAFKPVNQNGSTWDIVEGVCTELICDLKAGHTWPVGTKATFVIKEVRLNAGTGTLGDHDLAIVGRDSYATVLGQNYKVGDEIELSTTVNFESSGTPNRIMQAVSGNILAMKDGVNNSSLSSDSYCKNSNERTLYATNAAGNRLWILVCEHNVAQSKKYFGWSTSQMCDIARSFGATNATQVDCGGSAQMWLSSGQVSQSYDSSGIRGVYNGMFVISTDPDAGATSSTESSMDFSLSYSDVAIDAIAGKTVKRVIAKGNYAYILAHDANLAPTLIVYDHANRSVVRTLGTANCVGNGSTLSDIALADDGILVGCGRTLGNGALKDNMMIVRWANAGDGYASGEAIQWNISGINGNWTTNDTGETICYTGTTSDGRLFYTSKSNANSNMRYCCVNINSAGQIGSAYYNLPPTGLTTRVEDIRLFRNPAGNGSFIINGSAVAPCEINFVQSTRGQSTVGATLTSDIPNSAAHTDVFKHEGKWYMVGKTTNGAALTDITKGFTNVVKIKVNGPVLTNNATANAAAAGTTVTVAGEPAMAIIIVRDGKISKYTEPDASGSDTPIDPKPTYNGERADFAYALGRSGTRNTSYTVSYTLTGDAECATLTLTPKTRAARTVTMTVPAKKGVNTATIDPFELEPGVEYTWSVTVNSKPVPASGKLTTLAGLAKDARGGVAIVTNPESDAYGRVIVSNGYAAGWQLYAPDYTTIGTYHAGMAPLVASNRSDTYRIGMRDGMIAYAAAFSDKGAGFWKFDPANPTVPPTNLSAGTNDGTGCIKIGDNVTGTGSPAVAFTGTGASTRVWSFAEDWPSGNSSYKGILCRWDIGNAEQITGGINAAYDQYAGNKLFAIQNMCIAPYGEGIFMAQVRNNLNSTGCPCLVYTDIYGTQLYNSGSDPNFVGTCGSGIAITADGSLLAVSGNKSNIQLYSVAWNGMTPTLTHLGEIDDSTNPDNGEVPQMAFDPAGNLYAYFRGSSSVKSSVHVFAIANEAPKAVTRAKEALTIIGADAPVEFYLSGSHNNWAEPAEADYFVCEDRKAGRYTLKKEGAFWSDFRIMAKAGVTNSELSFGGNASQTVGGAQHVTVESGVEYSLDTNPDRHFTTNSANESRAIHDPSFVISYMPERSAPATLSVSYNRTTGVESVATDADSGAPVEFYNLQGVRVDAGNLAPGIYIRRQGKSSTKVIVD